ncbi:hypothetical protein MYXA107069_20965 [Myxococcus xanthus]|nr:hypothetical protein MyxoNM_27895 [Myxococcus xanthus]SDY06494.1 hypothetical protein SAMN05444383_117164 [Myxococcus xanthus]
MELDSRRVPGSSSEHRLAWAGTVLLGVALMAIFLLACLLLTGGGLDDSFITYRYAKHLAGGHGIAWNVGEQPPVEGYTSFLWVVLNAIPIALGGSPLLASKLLSIAAAGAIIVLTLSGAHPIQERPWRAVLATLVALCTPLAYYTQTGMETVFFTALAFASTGLALREFAGNPRPLWLMASSTLFGLAAITRPEGVMLFGLIAASGLSLRRSAEDGRISRRTLLFFVAPFFAIWLTYFMWRLQHYGWLFPNTYYAKHSGNRLLNLPLGVYYLVLAWAPYLAAPVSLGALAWVATPTREEDPSARRSLQLALHLGGACLVYVLYIVWVGGDDRSAFPSVRLVLPVLPLLWMATVMLVAGASRHWTKLSPRACAVGVAALISLAWAEDGLQLLKASVPAGGDSRQGLLKTKLAQFTDEPHGPLPAWILEHTQPTDVIAVPWAGRVPYATGRPTLDMLGLNDTHIAHLPSLQRGIDVKMDPEYVLARRPKLIFVNVNHCYVQKECSFADAGGWKIGDRQLIELLRQSPDYDWVKDAPTDISVFRRRESLAQ